MSSTHVVYPDEDMGPAILGSTLTVTGIALVSLALRLYVRIGIIKSVGWDDYVMILSMTFVLAGQAVIIPEVHYGAGKHIDHIHPGSNITVGLKLNFITQPIFLWSISLAKISIGFFLLRIASSPLFRRIISGIMGFMLLYTIVCFITIVLQCRPLATLWNNAIPGTCFSQTSLQALAFVNAALSICTDVAFAVFIPIPMLWSVQLNRRTKASLVCILGLGVFASAAAIVKTSYIASYGRTGDWLWDSRNLTIWTVVESSVGIIAGNLPCLKPLFRRVLHMTSSAHSRGQPHPYGLPSSTYAGKGSALKTTNRYSTLDSGPEERDGPGVYVGGKLAAGGPVEEAHMMTRISARDVGVGIDADDADMQMDVASKASSDEGILPGPGPGRCGITKTTVTHVSYTTSDASAPARREKDRI